MPSTPHPVRFQEVGKTIPPSLLQWTPRPRSSSSEGEHMSRTRLRSLVVVLFVFACTKEHTDQQQTTMSTAGRFAAQPSNWKETEVDVFPGMDGITLDKP